MKLFFRLILLFALFASKEGLAQLGRGKITAAEFYFDTDPGQGSATSFTLQGNANDAFRSAVKTATLTLSAGSHVLHVRYKDSLDQWSSTFKTVLVVDTLLGARNTGALLGRAYWNGNTSNATNLIILNGNITHAVNTFIETTALSGFSSPGLQKLSVEIMGVDGQFGKTFSTVIQFDQTLTFTRIISAALAEVYWDNNVAQSSGLIILNGNGGNAINTFITTSAINTFSSAGIHKINVRMYDPNPGGNVSPVFTTLLKIDETLTPDRTIRVDAGKIWLDANVPSSPNLLALDGNYNQCIEEAIHTLSVVTQGVHTISVQFRDSTTTNWGPIFKTSFVAEGPLSYRNINVASGQLFWDNDTNFMMLPLVVFDGAYSDAIEAAFVNNVPTPGAGLHLLCARFKEVANNWSGTFRIPVKIDNPISVRDLKLVQGEVQISDTSFMIIALNGNFNKALDAAQTSFLSGGIPTGLHKMKVRMKGLDAHWGPWFTSALLITNCISAANPTITPSGPLSFCNGGQVVLQATAGYNTYTWYRNNVQVGTGTSFTATQSGSYVVVVTDGTNCPGASPAATVNVGIPDATITGNPTFCAGSTDSLMVPQGYTSYTWSGGGTSYKKYITLPGTYTVTVTNSAGCTNSSSFTIAMLPQPSQPVVTANGPTSICPGQQVTLTSNVTGNIQWNVGPSAPSITVDSSGLYYVTVTGANGCTNSSTPIQVIKNGSPTANVYASGPLTFCDGEQVTLSTDAANAYLWNTGATTASITVTTSGSYSVIRTVNTGCQAQSANVTVVVNPLPNVPVVSASGPLDFCNGNSVVLTSNSSSNNTWSTHETAQSITVYSSAVVVDTVTNSFGCKSWSAPVTVNVHPVATIQASGATTFCDGDQVTLTAQPSSGVNYLWSNGATTQSIPVTTSQNLSVIVTEIGPGCKDTAYQNVTVHPLPSGTISASGSTTICDGTNLVLNTSGSPNCIYQWYFNGSPITYSVYQYYCSCYQTYNVYGYSLNAGNSGSYQAKIIDTLTGCFSFTNSISVNVILPSKPVITANGGTTLCIGANTQLTSTPAVSYLWNNGATTQQITATTAGNYVVTITDVNGCTRSSDPTPVTFYPIAQIVPSGPTTFCSGSSVNLSSSINGSYQWSTGSTNATLQNISAAGIYTLVVTDINGCTSPATSVTVVVNPLPVGSIQYADSAAACEGNAVVFHTSSVPNCIYKWYRNGVALSYPVYNNQCACYVTHYVYGYSYSATSSGNYSAEIIDTLTGCSSVTTQLTATIMPLPVPSIVQTAFISCNGQQTATLVGSAGGSISPYAYSWSNNISNTVNSNLGAGTYALTVTDGHGCTQSTSYTVSQPAVITAMASSPTNTRGYQISCYGGNDGSASVSATGGNPPYTYLWNTGATTSTISNLVAGTYTVTVFDAQGCTPGTATVTLTQPPILSVSLQPVTHYGGHHISCFGGHDGKILTLVTGGTATMSYAWSNGQTSAIADSLLAGSYTVIVTDSVGCTATSSTTLTQPSSLTHSFSTSQFSGYEISCYGLNDGTIQTLVNGGISPYHIFWTDTNYNFNRSNVVAGTYHVVISDTLGCTNIDSIVMHQPDSIQLVTTNDTLNCYGDQNGEVIATASGMFAPFTYQWTSFGSNAIQSNLAAGNYVVTATDTRGCTRVGQASVSQPSAVQAYAFGTFIGCGTQIGLLSVTGTGGFPPYTQLWSNGSTASFQNNQPLGTYSVTLTDMHGCIDTATAIIIQPPTLNATVTNYSTTCDSITTVPAAHVSVAVTGGVPPYMYLWSNGATTSSIQNLSTGYYNVIVTDANGCTVNPTAYAFNNDAASFTGDTLVCIGEAAHLTAMPGSNYQWKIGNVTVSTQASVNLDPGIYTLTMVNLNGCTVSKTFHVQEHNCNTVITIGCYLEGYYNGGGLMKPVLWNQGIGSSLTDCDTITVELHEAVYPYNVVQSNQVMLQTNGTASVSYPPFTDNLYLVIKQRNHVETWSAAPIALVPGSNNYDFTTQANKAFGSNQTMVAPGKWAFYCGDINQDLTVDVFDFLIMDPDIIAGVGGYYVTDVNGDGAVDSFDYISLEPNIVGGVGAATP